MVCYQSPEMTDEETKQFLEAIDRLSNFCGLHLYESRLYCGLDANLEECVLAYKNMFLSEKE